MSAMVDRRSESRTSRMSGSDHGEIDNSTMNALVEDLNKTTEVIRRHQIERRAFQTEMEVNGRISIEPSEDWLNIRLKSVSKEDMKNELGKIKDTQKRNVVEDTMAALVYDVNATAEVLRRGSLKRKKPEKDGRGTEEIEYRLRLTPAPDDDALYHKEDLPLESTFGDNEGRRIIVEILYNIVSYYSLIQYRTLIIQSFHYSS